MFMPRVELLADSDFEPAAVPRVDGLNLLGAAGRQKLCLHSRDIPEVLLCLLVQVVTKNGQPLFRYISVRSQRTGIEKALLLMHTELAVILRLEKDIHAMIVWRSLVRKHKLP